MRFSPFSFSFFAQRFSYVDGPKEGLRFGAERGTEYPSDKFDRVVDTLEKEKVIVTKDLDAAAKDGVVKDVLDGVRKRLDKIKLKKSAKGKPILYEDIQSLEGAHKEIAECASVLAAARRDVLAGSMERDGKGAKDDTDAKKEGYKPLTDKDFSRMRRERQEAFRSAKVLDGKMRVGEKFLVDDSVQIFTRGGNLFGAIDLGKDEKGKYTKPTEVEVVNTHVRQVKAKGDLGDMKGFEDGQTVDMVAVKVHMTKEHHGFSRDRTYVGWIPKSFLKPFGGGVAAVEMSKGDAKKRSHPPDASRREQPVQVQLADSGERRGPPGGSAKEGGGLRDKPDMTPNRGRDGMPRGDVRGDGIDLPGYHRDPERILREGVIKDSYEWQGDTSPARKMARDVIVACAQNPERFDPKFLEKDIRKEMDENSVQEGEKKVFRPSDGFKRRMIMKVLDFLREMGV